MFEFQRGPIFAQIVLADEINRATPKTQSALLEAMQEHSVTVGGTIHQLKEPFFVMATQNPIEQEGTYPLPEAQLDRFLFKLVVGYSTREELSTILDRTTRGEQPQGREGDRRRDAAAVPGSGPRGDHRPARAGLRDPAGPGDAPAGAVRRRRRRTSTSAGAPARAGCRRWSWPRRSAPCSTAGTTSASRTSAASTCPRLRHRVLLNFEAQAEGIDPDEVLLKVLDAVPEKAEETPSPPWLDGRTS